MIRKQLTEICRPKQWKTIPGKDLKEQGFPVYGANGIIGYWDEYNHEKETLTIACRGTCGTVNIAGPKSYINGNAMCLDELSDEVELKYLYYFLKGYDFKEIISGTTISQITIEGLKKVTVAIPSKERQLELVAIFDKVSEVILNRQQKLQKLDELVKARFVEIFGDLQINDKHWKTVLIGDFCFVTKLAGFEYTNYIRYDNFGDVVMVKAQNVKNGKLNRKELSFISKEVSDSLPRSQLAPGDVVMTYVGANIGDVALIDDEYKYHLAPNVAKISPDKEKYNPVFFMHMLAMLRGYIVGNSADTAKAALGMERIRQLSVFLPPIDMQNQFAGFVDKVDKSKVVAQKALEEAQLLFDSLMQKYFG